MNGWRIEIADFGAACPRMSSPRWNSTARDGLLSRNGFELAQFCGHWTAAQDSPCQRAHESDDLGQMTSSRLADEVPIVAREESGKEAELFLIRERASEVAASDAGEPAGCITERLLVHVGGDSEQAPAPRILHLVKACFCVEVTVPVVPPPVIGLGHAID